MPTLSDAADQLRMAVEAFHKKMNLDFKADLSTMVKRNDCPMLRAIMHNQAEAALTQYGKGGDLRLLRLHLVLEECGEWLTALMDADEVKLMDATCDLVYVLLGTLISFDLPFGEGFAEVQKSNMTKTPKGLSDNSAEQARLRDKGTKFKAPNLEAVLVKHRKKTR
jgi:phosphoribosyl-ATP pyrophosphohydrolase